jgi:hypothetical protein
VLLAARGVAVSYTPELTAHQYDPDDLEELRRAVVALYACEGEHGVVLSPEPPARAEREAQA